jgi:hypothetical protein
VALTRREWLWAAALAPLAAVLPVAAGCGGSGPSCNDADTLTTSQQRIRESFAYADRSPHGQAKHCAGCRFFEARGETSCGHCPILNSPVSPAGHCNSWSARA